MQLSVELTCSFIDIIGKENYISMQLSVELACSFIDIIGKEIT